MADNEDIDLAALSDDELVEQMHNDLYDGMKDEIVEGTKILLDRGFGPTKVLDEALVAGMRIVGIDFRDGILFVPDAINLDEVQDYISLSSHQLSSNLVIIGPVWNDLSTEQQEALATAVEEAMVQEPQCAAEAEEEILAGWRDSGDIEIVEDVDRDAFRNQVEPYLRDNFSAEQVEVLEAIRSTADE